MNFISNIFKPFATSTRNGNPNNVGAYFSGLLGYPISDEITNLQLSAVFRCIELISDSVSVLPIEGTDLADNVINMPKSQWLKLIVRNVIINGNAFTYIHTDGKGNPTKLEYLMPSDVSIIYDPLTQTLKYQVVNHKGINVVFPEKMLHFRKITTNGVEGKSIIPFAAHALKLAKLTEQACEEYFDTQNFQGFLQTEDQLSPDKQREIESNFNFFLKNKSCGILSNGLTFSQLKKDNAKDSEMIEAREYNDECIARFFGVPIELLRGQTSHNGLEQSQQEFYARTLQSYIVMVEEEMNRKLFGSIDLDESAMMRMTMKDKADYLNQLVQGGILNINEARAELGYQPISGGDKNFVAYTSVEDNRV